MISAIIWECLYSIIYRVKKRTFQFVIDKVQKKLNGFDVRLLSMAGRVTLAKSVLLAISGYFMQSAMVPVGVCEKIEQMVWNFVWGSTSNTRKIHLVNWDTCRRPMVKGGLVLWRLVPQNHSFLMKLDFQITTNVVALWVRILSTS